jgi:hypothetical protein
MNRSNNKEDEPYESEGVRKGMSDSEINERTKFPLAIMVACIVAFTGGAWWIATTMTGVKHELAELRRSYDLVNNTQTQLRDSFASNQGKLQESFMSRLQFENWTLRLRLENPSIKIPEFKP